MPPPRFADSSPDTRLPERSGVVTPKARRLAPAKLNLGLHVRRRRPDGYHDIETVMVPLAWADRLAATPADAVTLSCSDASLPTDGRNLVVRAAEALAAWVRAEPTQMRGANLFLDKRVPYGAGLGGGSSDAAAALRLLAEWWTLDVPPHAMHALAAGLGSDVPFFLDAVPALATGRGETLTPLVGPGGEPYALPFWLTVVVPPVHVSTADAYRLVVPDDGDRPDLAALVATNDPDRWRRELVNDFQGPVEALHPEVASARAGLTAAGAAYASLSGSGSAVFGVFEAEAEARSAAGDAEAAGARVWTEGPATP